jgi:hypothetical protein
MYAARCRKPTGFNSEQNTLPGTASDPGAPAAAEDTLVIVCLLRG